MAGRKLSLFTTEVASNPGLCFYLVRLLVVKRNGYKCPNGLESMLMLASKTKENIEKDCLYTRANVFLSFYSSASDRILRSYKRSLNGFAAKLSKEEAHKLSGL
jgi:hypothetical protein